MKRKAKEKGIVKTNVVVASLIVVNSLQKYRSTIIYTNKIYHDNPSMFAQFSDARPLNELEGLHRRCPKYIQ